MKKIQNFNEACELTGRNPNLLPDVSMLPEKDRERIIAFYMLGVIQEALNEGWSPDWKEWGERKYFPWFDVVEDKSKASGFGLSCNDYGSTRTPTTVSSRLVYKTAEIAEYAGTQFKELYEKALM
jgi:hypothetical protein